RPGRLPDRLPGAGARRRPGRHRQPDHAAEGAPGRGRRAPRAGAASARGREVHGAGRPPRGFAEAVKAKPVEGLDPSGPFRENAARIVRTRLDELYSFDPAIRDPRNVTELHDMRIAAKRLRYVLEIVGFAFGPPGKQLQQEASWLQEVLGEVHDCDVL